VLTRSRGSIGVVGSFFEVMTHVDLGLTKVSRFDLADPAISVNDANLKPGASHIYILLSLFLVVSAYLSRVC
jgi:hypothetical protein